MVVSADSQIIIKKPGVKLRGLCVRKRRGGPQIMHSPHSRSRLRSIQAGRIKKRQNKSRKVSSCFRGAGSIRVSRRPVSLFMLPFISSLFIFSIYINISDSFWQVRSPDYPIYDLKLPGEETSVLGEEKTLKASVDLSLLMNPQQGNENPEWAFYLSSYTIRDDDRYSIIAEKFHISLDSLLSVNRIDNNTIPEVGSEIQIPNLSGIYYSVQKGDTLTSIASTFSLDMEEISRINQLYTTVIHIGEELFLPDVKMDEDILNRIIGNKFIIPAAGTVKNSYGSSLDLATGLKNYNYGIDIINTKGTAVFAARDGIVNNTSYNAYFGRVVLLNHSGSFQSMYGCLDSIAVEPGQTIQQGDILGYIGNSGFKANEHLQFSIFKNKEDVDTLEYIF
jgi:LysM repeat protein